MTLSLFCIQVLFSTLQRHGWESPTLQHHFDDIANHMQIMQIIYDASMCIYVYPFVSMCMHLYASAVCQHGQQVSSSFKQDRAPVILQDLVDQVSPSGASIRFYVSSYDASRIYLWELLNDIECI